MGAIYDQLVAAKKEELSAAIENEAKVQARNDLTQKAVGADQRVNDIQANLSAAQQEREAIQAEIAELDSANQPTAEEVTEPQG